MNYIKIFCFLALFNMSLNAILLENDSPSDFTLSSKDISLFYINIPKNSIIGSILVSSDISNLKDIIEIKSRFDDIVNDEYPLDNNSLLYDTKNKLNEIIYTLPNEVVEKKFFIFSIKNKGEAELTLTLTPLKIQQQYIVNSSQIKKLSLSYQENKPVYYQLDFQFEQDIKNAIIYCNETKFLLFKNEINQESLDNANNKTVSVFEKNEIFNRLIIKIFGEETGSLDFYFQYTNKTVIYIENKINQYYETEFTPFDKGEDIYVINADDEIFNKYILFRMDFGDTFTTFYSTSAKLDNEELQILPNEEANNIIQKDKYISSNSKFQIFLIKHKSYGQAKYIFVNPKLSSSNIMGEDYFYFENGQKRNFNIQTKINFRLLHLYGGELNYRINQYDLMYEEDSYGYFSSSKGIQFTITAYDESIIQATFVTQQLFQKVYKSSTVFNKNGILILLPKNKEYKTFKISIEAKYVDSNEDVVFTYSHGVIEKLESTPNPSISGNGKTAKNKIKFYGLNPYFFSNYRTNEDFYYYSLFNQESINTTYNILMEYDQINKNNSISINNLINLEKDIKFYLEGSDFKNNYITYMLQSCSNKEKSLQFSYYDFKTNIYSHESYLNFMEIPLNYENISITLNLEENDAEPLFFYYFSNESTNIKLLNDFSEKSNNFKFDYYFRNSILFWKEPFNDIEYKNLTIYTYDHK